MVLGKSLQAVAATYDLVHVPLLFVSSTKKDALESNGLMGTNEDTNTKIISSHDLGQSGVLGVGQTYSIKLDRNLQTKGSQFSQSLNSVFRNSFLCIID